MGAGGQTGVAIELPQVARHIIREIGLMIGQRENPKQRIEAGRVTPLDRIHVQDPPARPQDPRHLGDDVGPRLRGKLVEQEDV